MRRAFARLAGWLLGRIRLWNEVELELYRSLNRAAREQSGPESEVVRQALGDAADAIRTVYDRTVVDDPIELTSGELRRLYGLYVTAYALLESPLELRQGIAEHVRRLPLDLASVDRALGELEGVEPRDYVTAGRAVARLVCDSVRIPDWPEELWQVMVCNQLRPGRGGPAPEAAESRGRAKILIRGSFHLRSPSRFVLYGDIVEGKVQVGMRLYVPLNSGLGMEAPIAAAEFVDGTPTGSHLGLVLRLDDPDDLALWQGLDLVDEVLEVRDSGG